ncbi:MAG: hypothetical protein IPK78_18060 [Rhodospirillales bacterium]|nr:hypothetical protein [Rhodospirillales bacterium]
MQVVMLTRYSPAKGQRLERGAVVDLEDEVAIDMIQRGLAEPVAPKIERAVGAGQKV